MYINNYNHKRLVSDLPRVNAIVLHIMPTFVANVRQLIFFIVLLIILNSNSALCRKGMRDIYSKFNYTDLHVHKNLFCKVTTVSIFTII